MKVVVNMTIVFMQNVTLFRIILDILRWKIFEFFNTTKEKKIPDTVDFCK